MAPVTAKLARLGIPNGAKTVKKPLSKSIGFWIPLRIDVLSDFDWTALSIKRLRRVVSRRFVPCRVVPRVVSRSVVSRRVKRSIEI